MTLQAVGVHPREVVEAPAPPPPPAPLLMKAGTHLPALDGLRGLAILLVLVFHFFLGHDHPARLLGKIAYTAAGTGWVGVDLFFVLSGFLITGILFEAKGSGHYFRDFYMKRVLRIFPLYYGVLVFFFVLIPLVHQIGSVRQVQPIQWWMWAYCSNIKNSIDGDWSFDYPWVRLNQFWSLAVEEHFYIVWPAVVFFLSRRAVMRVCLGCIAAALALRVWLYFNTENDIAIYTFTLCRMDGLALGSLLALWMRGGREVCNWIPAAKWTALVAGATFVGLIVVSGAPHPVMPLIQTIGYTVAAVFFGALVVLAVASPQTGWLGRWFRHPFMRFFGKYSYGLYVFHQICRPAYDKFFPAERLVKLTHSYTLAVVGYGTLATLCTIAVAMASWHLYEKHFLKLKKYFSGHKVPGASVPVEVACAAA